MRYEMKMPDLAATESDIRIVRWLVEPGDRVARGQPILEVETDKATMEVESVAAGVLSEVRSQVDDTVAVGQVIAVLEVEDAPPAAVPLPVTPEANPAPSAPAAPAAGPVRESAGRPVGMFARNRAAAQSKGADRGIALSVAQRTAARRLQESKQTIPHFYLQTSADASAMIARREAAGPEPPVWDAFFVLAVARAIRKFERFRCRLEGERLVPADTDAIGVAIDRNGELFVVPIASPAGKTVEEISAEIRRGAERLAAGDQDARRIRSALMTVTNLGMTNAESFVPIINPPETAILGIGRVMPTPVAKDDGQIGVEPRVTLTLCVDHRVASGRYAGDFLGAIVEELESV